jgi:hypothetical protein
MDSPPLFDEQRMGVASALRELERSLAELTAALSHGSAALVSVDGDASATTATRRICEAYSVINLGMEDAPGKSVICLGVIGVGREAIAIAERINAAKAGLKTICAPLQRTRTRVPDGNGTKALPVIRVILRSLQRSDLNLLAAYRRIPILGATPLSVSYTRARTRSVYRKSVAELMVKLQNSDSPRAIGDRARLSALPANITHLALVRDHYENVRANILYDGLDSRGRGRVQVAAELPLMYLVRRQSKFPVVTYPALPVAGVPEAARQRRSKLEPRPYLEALPVFRYLPEPL